MSAAHDPTSTVSIPHTRSSVGTARRALVRDLRAAGMAVPVIEDSVLVLSELVSNAVKHAAPLPGGDISVRWAIGRDSVHLEITDGGGPTVPRVESPTASALGGRGLDIVRTVCTGWGVTEGPDRVTVWADLPRQVTAISRRAMQAAGCH